MKEMHQEYGENSWWPYITYGFIATDCKMMVSACAIPPSSASSTKIISFEEFLDLRIHE
jgi:hypothetical protein